MTAHAPYWPIATLIVGVLIGAALRGLIQQWEDR